MSENFFHSCAFKNTAVICLISNEFVSKLLVKADRFDAAVDDYLLVTAFLNPLFRFAHGHGTELFSAVFRQNDHAADGCRACIYFVEAAGRDRIFVIQQDYVLGGVAVVLVELLAERNVVLPVHALDAHGVRARTLSFFCCPENFDIH